MFSITINTVSTPTKLEFVLTILSRSVDGVWQLELVYKCVRLWLSDRLNLIEKDASIM